MTKSPNAKKIWMCNNPKSPFLLRVDEIEQRAYWFRADCKLWTCSECAEQRKTRVASRAWRGADRFAKVGFPVQFTTLTSHRHVRTRDASIKRWREAWPRLRKRCRRQCEEFHYGVFPEQHKDGTVHIHLLETSGLSQTWFKDNCAGIGLGYMAKVKPVPNPARAAKYVTKYMSKAIAVTNWPRGFHRYRFSQRWPDVETFETIDVEWQVFLSAYAFDDEMRHWVRRGYRPTNTRTGEIGHG